MLFKWESGDPILLQPNYGKLIPPSNHTANQEPKGDVGRDVIVFGYE